MIARESEAQLTETRCTAQEFQRYLTTNYASLARDELDALLMLYFKLQSPMMTKGIETLLERVPGERSRFQQARDLEMKAQWDVATEKYRQLFEAAGETEDVAEEVRSAYYRCLQSGGLWSDVLHVSSHAEATRAQSTQLLYWKMEASWRRREWPALRRLTSELEWLLESGASEPARAKRGEERGSFAFEYYLSKLILAFQQNHREEVMVCVTGRNEAKTIVDAARLSLVRSLASHPQSSIQTVYGPLLCLHVLQDIVILDTEGAKAPVDSKLLIYRRRRSSCASATRVVASSSARWCWRRSARCWTRRRTGGR